MLKGINYSLVLCFIDVMSEVMSIIDMTLVRVCVCIVKMKEVSSVAGKR